MANICHNTPGMPVGTGVFDMKRRALLKSLQVVAALPALAVVPALAETETPILRLFREHREIMDAAARYTPVSTGKAEDEEMDRLFYQRADWIEAELMALPCTCAADFAAKVIVDTVKGGLFSDWETGALWVEARALTRSVI